MANNIGIWIDHREARIVALRDGEESLRVIESDLEKPAKAGGGARSKTVWGPQDVAPDDKRDRRFHNQLDKYYKTVIEALHGADAIFVFGPGEAKTELKKQLDDTHILRDRVVGVETADSMTQPQTAARVREFFSR